MADIIKSLVIVLFLFCFALGSFCSYFEIEQMLESEVNSDVSLPTQLSGDTSDSMFISSSESSYNSDQGSGNEDGRDASYVIFEESSDEVDFLAL